MRGKLGVELLLERSGPLLRSNIIISELPVCRVKGLGQEFNSRRS